MIESIDPIYMRLMDRDPEKLLIKDICKEEFFSMTDSALFKINDLVMAPLWCKVIERVLPLSNPPKNLLLLVAEDDNDTRFDKVFLNTLRIKIGRVFAAP